MTQLQTSDEKISDSESKYEPRWKRTFQIRVHYSENWKFSRSSNGNWTPSGLHTHQHCPHQSAADNNTIQQNCVKYETYDSRKLLEASFYPPHCPTHAPVNEKKAKPGKKPALNFPYLISAQANQTGEGASQWLCHRSLRRCKGTK